MSLDYKYYKRLTEDQKEEYDYHIESRLTLSLTTFFAKFFGFLYMSGWIMIATLFSWMNLSGITKGDEQIVNLGIEMITYFSMSYYLIMFLSVIVLIELIVYEIKSDKEMKWLEEKGIIFERKKK